MPKPFTRKNKPMDLNYHRSMLIGSAARKGNGWAMLIPKTGKLKTLFWPAYKSAAEKKL